MSLLEALIHSTKAAASGWLVVASAQCKIMEALFGPAHAHYRLIKLAITGSLLAITGHYWLITSSLPAISDRLPAIDRRITGH